MTDKKIETEIVEAAKQMRHYELIPKCKDWHVNYSNSVSADFYRDKLRKLLDKLLNT
jgi:hypothetical protein